MPKRKSRSSHLARALLGVAAILGTTIVGCDDGAVPASKPGSVVSLSPAATDLILAMGAGDRLTGVSTYEMDPQVKDLPRVGDYLTTDWERIASLKPEHLVVQMAADRMPSGFADRAKQLGIAVHRVQIDRLDDVVRTAEQIGTDINDAEAGRVLSQRIRDGIAAARTQSAGKQPIKTLIALSDDGLAVAGGDTFLDDILVAAGGVNALGPDRKGYLTIDRELLASLAPEVIIHLTPPQTPAAREANDRLWASFHAVPAVENKRVLTIDEPWGLLPASHVVDLAKRFVDHLHPTGQPTTEAP